jgi:K+ transporter
MGPTIPPVRSEFLVENFSIALLTLAAAIQAVTGVEAVYAAIGHFRRPATTRARLVLVSPVRSGRRDRGLADAATVRA